MIFVSVRFLFTPSLQKGNHTRAYESSMLRAHYFSSKKVLGSRASSDATKNHIKIIFYYFCIFCTLPTLLFKLLFFSETKLYVGMVGEGIFCCEQIEKQTLETHFLWA